MSDINRLGGGARSARWQDWCNLVLAVWLFISPWVLAFAASANLVGGTAAGTAGTAAGGAGGAAWDAWIFGVITAVVALSAMFSLRPWQEWINLLIGIWLFVAPWVVGFTSMRSAAWDHWIVGVLVFLLALSALSYARTAIDYAHAGDRPTAPPPRRD